MLSKPTMNPDMETEINLADLFRYLLTKWKPIIACALAGVIVLGVFSFVQIKRTPEADEQTVIDEFLENATYTSDDLARLDQISEVVVKEYSVMKEQQNYYAASMLPALDWANMTSTRTVYQLRLADAKSYDDLALMITAFNNRLNSDEFYLAVRDELGIDPLDLRQLYTASAAVPEQKDSISMDAEPGNMAMLSVYISGPDRAFCDKILAIAEKLVAKIGKDLGSTLGANTCALLQTTEVTGRNDNILNWQKKAASAGWTDYETNVTELEKGLSAAEVKYVQAKADQKLYVTGLKTKQEKASGLPVSKLMLVIGLILGGMAGVCVFALPYMTTGKETVHLELRDNYGIRVLLKADKKPGFRFRKELTYSADDLASLIAAELSAGEDKVRSLLISGHPCDEADKAFADKITKALSGKDIVVRFAKGTGFDPETVPAALEADAVLLLERVGVSGRNEVARGLTWCVDHDKPVFAAIVTI